ncbi:hypothetical protein SEPCBS119000_005011 [Sporothrix epigloea]|uniref:Uncharacterized protein n=1 Tax=Sporothrix epigloea TaxID=1892477 RepID=A0ABP0DZ26_9PEZI
MTTVLRTLWTETYELWDAVLGVVGGIFTRKTNHGHKTRHQHGEPRQIVQHDNHGHHGTFANERDHNHDHVSHPRASGEQPQQRRLSHSHPALPPSHEYYDEQNDLGHPYRDSRGDKREEEYFVHTRP